MKVSPTKAVIWIIGLSLVALTMFYSITGIFSIIISILVIALIGLIYGLITKEKRLWKPFLLTVIITLIGASIFFYLLSISNM